MNMLFFAGSAGFQRLQPPQATSAFKARSLMRVFGTFLAAICMLTALAGCGNDKNDGIAPAPTPGSESISSVPDTSPGSEIISSSPNNENGGKTETSEPDGGTESPYVPGDLPMQSEPNGIIIGENDICMLTEEDYFTTETYADTALISYLFHQPARELDEPVPLIISLHGLGDDIKVGRLGTTEALVHQLINAENVTKKYSAYTIVPITPTSIIGWWTDAQIATFKKLITDTIKNYNIDPKRVYITGMSMGGFTTCRLVNEMPPNTFAAAVPLCGAHELNEPEKLNNTAFYICHAADDYIVSVEASRLLYEQLTAAGNTKTEYLEMKSGGHGGPLELYSDRKYLFLEWLFEQKLP